MSADPAGQPEQPKPPSESAPPSDAPETEVQAELDEDDAADLIGTPAPAVPGAAAPANTEAGTPVVAGGSGVVEADADIAAMAAAIGNSPTTPDEAVAGTDDWAAGAEAATMPSASSRSRAAEARASYAAARRKRQQSLKSTISPIIITIGLLLGGFAVYGFLLLAGVVTSDKENAKAMALLMIFAGGGVGLILIGGGVFYLVQVTREKAAEKVQQQATQADVPQKIS